ncbi:OmpA family protein [Desulfuromonas sp. KJ2020]|uniref:OmpA family protein n=1 Tax=Desulfuromonas sp. KJ2020 TaxID=2919173 RepID=UPI0020A7E1CD|nr:OmpA family protein [Desulfuromonas sp. KJ2020]MCP3175996.1 OmpA family protein [Desulfuromonas sp. KJ2020]
MIFLPKTIHKAAGLRPGIGRLLSLLMATLLALPPGGVLAREAAVDNLALAAPLLEEKEYVLWPRFDSGSNALSAEDKALLKGLSMALDGLRIVHIYVAGHTDDRRLQRSPGQPFKDNFELSEARAQSVADYLLGILEIPPEATVLVEGLGDTLPVTDNSSEEGRAQNRRVEIWIQTERVPRPVREETLLSQRAAVPAPAARPVAPRVVASAPPAARQEYREPVPVPYTPPPGEAFSNRAVYPVDAPALATAPKPLPASYRDDYVPFYEQEKSLAAGRMVAPYFTPPGKWGPQLDMTYKEGTDRSLGRFSVMWPFWQTDDAIFFADLRVVLPDDSSLEGNYGLGYRKILDHGLPLLGEAIWGAYAFYDNRSSIYGFSFQQFTLGAELLGRNWELRANAYLPENTSHVIDAFSTTGVELDRTAVVVRTTLYETRERPLHGFDVEAGYGLEFGEKNTLWGHAGYFWFDNALTPEVAGPRLRLAYERKDPFSLLGSSLSLGVEYQDDQVRGAQSFGFANMRIPLGKVIQEAPPTYARAEIERRMMRPVIRDVDIVTFAQNMAKTPGTEEGPSVTITDEYAVVDPETEAPIDVFFVDADGTRLNGLSVADGTQSAPMTLAEAQQASSLSDILFLVNDAGQIASGGAESPALTLQQRQQLMGVGNLGTRLISFEGLPEGPEYQLAIASASGRPTLSQASTGDVVALAGGNRLSGLNISGGSRSIVGDGIDSLGLADLNVRDYATAGLALDNSTGTLSVADSLLASTGGGTALQISRSDLSGAFTGSTLAQTGGRVIDLDGHQGALDFRGTVLENQDGLGLRIQNGSNADLAFGRVNVAGTSSGEALSLLNNDQTTIAIDDLRIQTAGAQGLVASNGGSLRVASGGVRTVGGDALVLSETAVDLTLAEVAATGGGSALDFAGVTGQMTVTGTIASTGSTDAGVHIANSQLDLAANRLQVDSAAGTGVDIVETDGTLAFGRGSSVANSGGVGISVDGGSADLLYQGDLSHDSATSTVAIRNHTGGEVTFDSGTLVAGNGDGLQFRNADGTYNFRGTTTLVGGDAGIDILADSAGSFTFGSNTGIFTPSGSAFTLRDSSAIVDYSGTITQNGTGNAVEVANHTGGAVTFRTGTIEATDGNGLQFSNADGLYAFLGTNRLQGGNAGIDILADSAGSFEFSSGTSIVNPTGAALTVRDSTADLVYSGSMSQANAASLLDVANHSGGTLTLRTGNLTASNGNGLQFVNADGTYELLGVTSLNGGDAGIDILADSAGSFTFGSSTRITNPTGSALAVRDSSATVSYEGQLGQGNLASAVEVTNHAGGTLTFRNGAVTASNGDGLQFVNADGTYEFLGRTTLDGGDAGVDILAGSGGSFTFGADTSIVSPTGDAFRVNGSTASVTYQGDMTQVRDAALVRVSDHASGTLTFNTGSLEATAGGGLLFSNADGDYRFEGSTLLEELGSPVGIDIRNGSDGRFTFGSDTTIVSQSGTAFGLSGSAANVSYGGRIDSASGYIANINDLRAGGSVNFIAATPESRIQALTANNQGVRITNSAGNVSFDNLTLGSDTTRLINDPLYLDNNSGRYTFKDLDIFTNSGTGILARNSAGATLTVIDGLIDTTNAPAIDLDAITTNMTLASVRAVNAGDVGINLSNLSAGSRFQVLGDTSIDGATTSINIDGIGAGSAITFDQVDILDRIGSAIAINDADGLINFGDITVTNPNNVGGNTITYTNSLADVTVANVDIGGSLGNSLHLENSAGSFTVNGGSITGGTTGIYARNIGELAAKNIAFNLVDSGITLLQDTSSTMTATVSGNALGLGGFAATSINGSTLRLDLNSNTATTFSLTTTGGASDGLIAIKGMTEGTSPAEVEAYLVSPDGANNVGTVDADAAGTFIGY